MFDVIVLVVVVGVVWRGWIVVNRDEQSGKLARQVRRDRGPAEGAFGEPSRGDRLDERSSVLTPEGSRPTNRAGDVINVEVGPA
jgi:hypothetical protein